MSDDWRKKTTNKQNEGEKETNERETAKKTEQITKYYTQFMARKIEVNM